MLGDIFPAVSSAARANDENAAYPCGFSFEYGEPKIRKRRTGHRTIPPEPGRYDVLLCSEEDEIGKSVLPVNGTLSVREAGEGNFRFDVRFQYCCQIHEWTFLLEWRSRRFVSRISPCLETDFGRLGGSVHVVEKCSAVRLQIHDPPNEREHKMLMEFYAKNRNRLGCINTRPFLWRS